MMGGLYFVFLAWYDFCSLELLNLIWPSKVKYALPYKNVYAIF